MQTFLPYPSYTRSAEVLDDRRLGKQVVECRQIGRAITGQSSGWTRHPAVVMWDGHLGSLLLYARAMAEEWSRRRGTPDRWHKAWVNTLLDHEQYIRSRPGGWLDPPPWLGDLRLHWSHQAALHRKEPGKYPAEWVVHSAVHGDYFWPSKHSDYRKS